MTPDDVDAAVRWAVMDVSTMRAVDPERLAMHVSWERPNPRRKPTVRRTGHEGKPVGHEPRDVVARARMRRLLLELTEVSRALVIGAAFGIQQRKVIRWLREDRRQHFTDGEVRALREGAQQRLARRMVEVGLGG